MKPVILCRFQTGKAVRWGKVVRHRVHEILPDPFGPYEITGYSWDVQKVRLLAPCSPTKIVAVGINYADHAAEFGHKIPAEPLIFLKPPSAVIGPGDGICLPAASQKIEFEGELAVVIGRRARRVSVASAPRYILGYSIMNDVTARDLQRSDGQWTRAKGFDTFAPLGPWVVTGLSPADLKIETYVNDRRKQSSRTSRLIFSPHRLVSFISRVMTLEPGDVISTGTPSGVGPLHRGDRVEIRIQNIGSLKNRVV